MLVEIRNEKLEEFKDVGNIVRESFWDIYRPGCSEHLILHNYRKTSDYVTELTNIITLNDEIIGQILFSKSNLENMVTNEKLDIGTFGPVSISPKYQKKAMESN